MALPVAADASGVDSTTPVVAAMAKVASAAQSRSATGRLILASWFAFACWVLCLCDIAETRL